MSGAVRRLELGIRGFLPALARGFFRTSKSADITPSDIRRILVIRQHNQLGDMLCVVPLLRALRGTMPGATVDLMASPVNAAIMLNHRLLDNVLVYDKREYLGPLGLRPLRILRLAKNLRARKYDLVVVPATVSVSLTSDLLSALTGAPHRVGPAGIDGIPNPGAFLYSSAVKLDWRESPNRHQTLRNADILSGVVQEPDDLCHEMSLTHQELQAGKLEVDRMRTHSTGLVVVLHPGAGKPPNRWPVRRFAELARRLKQEFHAAIAVTIGPMDSEVRRDLESELGDTVKFVVNMPIRRVASIIYYAGLVVSNDTGIMHVAAAVGTPLVALFGPTDPHQWAPIGASVRYIWGKPIGSISVEQVLRMTRGLVAGSPAPNAKVPG